MIPPGLPVTSDARSCLKTRTHPLGIAPEIRILSSGMGKFVLIQVPSKVFSFPGDTFFSRNTE